MVGVRQVYREHPVAAAHHPPQGREGLEAARSLQRVEVDPPEVDHQPRLALVVGHERAGDVRERRRLAPAARRAAALGIEPSRRH